MGSEDALGGLTRVAHTNGNDLLSPIVARKRNEVRRRRAHEALSQLAFDAVAAQPSRGRRGIEALRRTSDTKPAVLAEIKFRSPSAGEIRRRAPGDVERVARSYERGGAAAVSVLADGPGFGGSPLDVRRVARAVDLPVLFKEFVIDEIQVRLARAVGASLVLLLVRLLDDVALRELVDAVRDEGMEPLVEAKDEDEVRRALAAGAQVVGVNARDLSTFRVDPVAAARAVEAIPADRVAVYMSGVASAEDVRVVGRGRGDALLVGEALMRAPEPGRRLLEWLQET